MKETESVISDIRLSRKNLVELIIIVVLLSFGINIIASQFLTWLKDQVVILTIIGTFLCILPVLYALISLFGKRKKQISVQGFVIYDPTKKELVNVPRYFFAQSMCTYIRAAFFENAAFKVRWNKQPLNPFKITPAGKESDAGEKPSENGSESELFSGTIGWRFGKVISAKENATARLLCEAAEYFLLEGLSFHLANFFDDEAYKHIKLEIYRREDIPMILLSNPFLELFTRPKADRPAFAERIIENTDGLHEDDINEETTYSWEEDMEDNSKYLYNPFRLVLPKGSKVKRLPDHRIEVETKKLKMILAVKFETKALAFDLLFLYFYLNYRQLLEQVAYEIKIDVQVSVKWHALLSSSGWDYYKWVDSFLHKIEEQVSEEAFMKKIHWEDALTVLQCLDNMEKSKNGQKIPPSSQDEAVEPTDKKPENRL